MTADARPGPARRRNAPTKGDRREAQILDASRELMSRKPVDAITIDEMATAAGISRTSFYFYFPTKNAVVAALAQRVLQQLDEQYDWFRSVGAAPDLLRAQLTGVAVVLGENAAIVRCSQQAEDSYEPLHRCLLDARHRHDELLAAKIDRDRRAGLAPGGPDSHALAEMVTVLRDGWFAQRAGDNSAGVARAVEELATAILRLIYGDAAPSDLLVGQSAQ